MKILVVRGDSLRHAALSAHLRTQGFDVEDFIVPVSVSRLDSMNSPLHQAHFSARDQVELDFFRHLPIKNDGQRFSAQSINSSRAVELANRYQPDYLVTFGCPILRQEWIEGFQNRIIGIHLGLSPYYRGSGTNYWPLVNQQPEAVGVTFMNLDSGIDTGSVVHQRRAAYVLGDSIHTVNTRLMSQSFDDLAQILMMEVNLNESEPINPKMGRYFKKSDFSIESLDELYRNFKEGIVERYLANRPHFDRAFPLVRVVDFDA